MIDYEVSFPPPSVAMENGLITSNNKASTQGLNAILKEKGAGVRADTRSHQPYRFTVSRCHIGSAAS